MNLTCAHSRVCLLEQQTAKMAEEPDPGKTPAKSPATPTLKELSNALDAVVDWHSLGVKLGLEDHELSAIDKNFRGDIARCKHETLICCSRSGKLPTWKGIADALQLMGEDTVASEIQARHCSFLTATDTATPPVTSPQSLSAVAIAQRNIRMIEGKFSTLVTKSCRRLQSRKIKIKDVQTFLITMYSSPRSKDGGTIIATVVESAKSLDKIFRTLSKYRLWDYLNYYLLQTIIDEFADDDEELNHMMEQYQKDLTGYILTLQIQTYLDAINFEYPIATSDTEISADEEIITSLPPQQKRKLFKKLTIKCKVNVTDHTLSYVIDLWRSLANQLALPQLAMILHDIAKGSIGITWLIPANLVKHVTKMAQETANMFTDKQILRVTLEKQCIYPMETELASEPTLLETEPTLSWSETHQLEAETTALKRKIEGSTGVISADLPAVSTEGSRSWDSPVSDQDDPENPEDIPEHELSMIGPRVMCTNYSLLWQYLEPSRLLPILVDKLLMTETARKEAESYTQKFAQNAVIIYQLFASNCPPLKLCDTLDVTGQEHIARKILQDYKHPIFRKVQPPSVATAVPSDLCETPEMFQQLQRTVMDLLDQFPNALAKLKQVLASLVLPLGEGKVAPLVDPLAYENAQTVQELFRLMAPYWNPLSTDLLGLLLEASGSKQAATKVAEFVEARASKRHLVLCIRQLPNLASGGNDLDVADLETVHNAPLSELQSLHPAVFARLPEHKVIFTRTTVRLSVEVNKPLVCLADYEEITTALSGLFLIPKAALVYAGCSKAPLALCWLVSHDLVEYIKSTTAGSLSGYRLLAEHEVTGVAVGDQMYKCPTIKEVKLWEAYNYGLVGQAHYLVMAGVNVNVTTFDGLFPLLEASQKGCNGIVEMLLQAGATVDLQSKDGWTALKVASLNGHHKVVEFLLGARAKPDVQNKDGFFPLYDASKKGYDRIVEMLLQAGATVDLQSKDGWTALKVASLNGHHKVVELLLGARAKPDVQNKDGFFPLYNASQEGYDRIVEMLLQAGATVDLHSKYGSTALEVASFKGHHKVVELLLAAGANPDIQDKDGGSPLHVASHKRYDGIVEMLLQAGATVDLQMKDGGTALQRASFNGHHKVVELLLGAGANPDIQEKDGFFPFYLASQEGYDGIVEMLLQAGATVNLQTKNGWTALKTASINGHHKVVELLLGAGANPDIQDKDGFFPLYSASQEGYDGIVEMLLQSGATVDMQNKDGWTALKRASFNGHLKVVELLIGAGANPDLQNKDGFFPLYYASSKGHDGIVEMLLQAGATVDLQQKDGWTALEASSNEGHHKVVELLIGAGSNPDLQDKDSWTALERASFNGHHKVVEVLLGAGANPDLQNKDGFFPLHDASQEGHDGIVEMLLQARATVDLQNKDGVTPLYVACYNGHLPVVERLIAAKADINHQKKGGYTPLMVASNNDQSSVVRVLLQRGATINTTSELGWTALHFAVREEHEDVVDQLLEAHADPDLPLKESQETALMMAAKKGNVGIVRKLIKHGANTKLTNKDGNTAYDLASVEGHTDVCQELLSS